MYTTDFAYDGPIFLVPLSLSYLSSPVSINLFITAVSQLLLVVCGGIQVVYDDDSTHRRTIEDGHWLCK